MHIRRPPSFFLAKRMGAPYAPLATSIRPDSRNFYNYSLSSASSLLSNGYSLRLGGGAFSSTNGILCSNCYGQFDLSTGYTGSANTSGYFALSYAIYSMASLPILPYDSSASSPPPNVALWVKFSYSPNSLGVLLQSNYIMPMKSNYRLLPLLAKVL